MAWLSFESLLPIKLTQLLSMVALNSRGHPGQDAMHAHRW